MIFGPTEVTIPSLDPAQGWGALWVQVALRSAWYTKVSASSQR